MRKYPQLSRSHTTTRWKKKNRLLLLHLPNQMISPLVLQLQERRQSDTLIGSVVFEPDCDVPTGMLGKCSDHNAQHP